ncbi:MAG: hypothetical protein QNJ00_17195 [Woeseiaceae bacterium]|nr:hypothetical protein [Woeseiaceae bacterium]
MSRSPLAYPLARGIDADSGGAADLQTDIMRFMAILALCLVAIFALVQSLPVAPQAVAEPVAVEQPTPVIAEPEPATPRPEPVVEMPPQAVALERPAPAAPAPREEPVALTRPKWTSTFKPAAPAEPMPEPVPAPVEAPSAPAEPEPDGFTLRFESDLALTRLVSTGQVGFYALDKGRAQRMTVSRSRISFWNASTPKVFHEMEASTVPRLVVDALSRAGVEPANVQWGVTLPGRLSSRLESLMHEHSGGALVIAADGSLDLETT